MQAKVLRVLEYEKMKEQLYEHVSSSLGRLKIKELTPSTDKEEILIWLEQTYEATKVLRLKGQIPLGGIFDIRASVKRAEIGASLNAAELLEIASTSYGARRLKKFIEEMIEDEVELPLLGDIVQVIIPLTDMEREIKQCISDNGEVLDSASPQLRGFRQQIRSLESGIRSKLESITRSQSSQKMLSDAIVTIRNDRFVVPVKQEYRGSFGGIVHDQSASGATLFIEPQAVVTMNNQLRAAKMSEAKEVERILHELTGKVAEFVDELLLNVDALGELDFIFTKARYSHKIKAVQPKLNDQFSISLFKARHPLIPIEEVVPIDVDLGQSYSSLIITGPNTGGKTVTLKTIGLLTLMAQSGLHIPADEGSEMAVFKTVFADIGDEQSIEQSLSTFSSHMVNIVEILKHVDHESLVLFDELGAGTDPTEGAALAIAILDDVYRRGARVVATTHYSELKGYAYNREGAMNASVEFNVETLRPTYRLLIGVPGRSNAFAISRRLGLEESIIDLAKSQITKETNQVENMIASLEESKKSSDAELEEARHIRKEAEQLRTDLIRQMEGLEQEKAKVLEEAENQAEEAVKKAKQEAEQIIKELRTLQKESHAIKEHKLIEAKKRLEEATPSLQQGKKQRKPKKVEVEVRPGDEVKVLSFGQKGIIVDKINEREFQVQIGIMKMKVAKDDIQPLETVKKKEPKPLATIRGNDVHVKPELDLRGERYEDAMLKVEKYLDDALLAGYHSVSIIHGKGTGALRKGVKELVKKHPHVKHAKDAAANEGGLGNTVVEFK
ncbi:endonuclease MutS2 [Alkalihalobacillus sp. LMS39]|uniref:endonuclease MutS2 n=1 Tax=Alkalihalobacillus sp. LMS39 TaxID=2924032 RepID=UPI001FB1AF47|nr:endonuclease MutS2 [Alkalihalobacillus sp. LMS39]UOE93382.1 endonuclease MutS2 [Alkalihalobacillus sp. LMS39]